LCLFNRKQHKDQSLLPSPKKLSVSPRLHAQNYGKLIMCKRLFQRISEIPDDPVELHLMYSQSVHSVVQVSGNLKRFTSWFMKIRATMKPVSPLDMSNLSSFPRFVFVYMCVCVCVCVCVFVCGLFSGAQQWLEFLLGLNPHDSAFKYECQPSSHFLYFQLDEYMVPIHIALHLAGIQAQVEFDDFEEDKLYR